MGNSITFFGRVSKDPELRYTADGNPILNLSVASDYGWGDKKATNWFNVSSFGKGGEALSNMLRKGSKIVVHGELQIRKSEGKDGTKYTNIDVRANNIELTQSKAEADGPTNCEDDDDNQPPPF